MKTSFSNDLKRFLKNVKRDSEKLKYNRAFEKLIRGLSEGTVAFRWGLRERIVGQERGYKKPTYLLLRYLVSAPIIYAMIIPVLLLDISVSLYQAICFRLWKIPQVPRKHHVILDRHRLVYLNWLQKINCMYCGYANGVMAYARTIAGETERYWCPVKHRNEIPAPHEYYLEFASYDDVESWNKIKDAGTNGWLP